MTSNGSDDEGTRAVGTLELFRVFGLIGCTAFGPAVLQSLRSVPVKRGWLRRADIDEGLGLVQLYPGAMMVDLVAYIGYRTHRIRGALAAVTGFIAPALILVLGLSWAYVTYGAQGRVGDLIVGLDAIVVGVVANVALDFAGQHVRTALAGVLAVAAFAAGVFGANLLLVVPAALVVGAVFIRPTDQRPSEGEAFGFDGRRLVLSFVPAVVVVAGVCVAAFTPGPLGEVTVNVAKIGAVAFGNGYTILPLLQQDVVDTHHWLTLSAFGAGIAFGQVTPGPILITAVFIGYIVAGWWGGVLAAVAIFAPSVAMTIIAAEIYPHVRSLAGVRGAIAGIMAAFVGLLATVVVSLGHQVLQLPATIVLAAAAFTAARVLKWRLPVVFASGIAAWAIYLVAFGPLHR